MNIKRSSLNYTGLGIILLTFVLTGFWLAKKGIQEPPADSTPTIVDAQASQSSQQFYLIPDTSDRERLVALLKSSEREPGSLFESRNSLGVPERIAEDFAELLPDFIFIGDDNAAREQFLANQSFVFENPQHYFKTEIERCVQTNGETRILAGVFIGIDGPTYGLMGAGPVTTKHVEVDLSEIWRVNPNGGAPTLLERIRCGSYDGKEWYHEHPDLLTSSEFPLRPSSDIMGGP